MARSAVSTSKMDSVSHRGLLCLIDESVDLKKWGKWGSGSANTRDVPMIFQRQVWETLEQWHEHQGLKYEYLVQ